MDHAAHQQKGLTRAPHQKLVPKVSRKVRGLINWAAFTCACAGGETVGARCRAVCAAALAHAVSMVRAARAAQLACRCVLLPGHGHKPCPPTTTFASYVDDLARSLPSEPIDLLGYSMGGRIALALAIAHPQRIRRLVLVSSAALRGFGLLWSE